MEFLIFRSVFKMCSVIANSQIWRCASLTLIFTFIHAPGDLFSSLSALPRNTSQSRIVGGIQHVTRRRCRDWQPAAFELELARVAAAGGGLWEDSAAAHDDQACPVEGAAVGKHGVGRVGGVPGVELRSVPPPAELKHRRGQAARGPHSSHLRTCASAQVGAHMRKWAQVAHAGAARAEI